MNSKRFFITIKNIDVDYSVYGNDVEVDAKITVKNEETRKKISKNITISGRTGGIDPWDEIEYFINDRTNIDYENTDWDKIEKYVNKHEAELNKYMHDKYDVVQAWQILFPEDECGEFYGCTIKDLEKNIEVKDELYKATNIDLYREFSDLEDELYFDEMDEEAEAA